MISNELIAVAGPVLAACVMIALTHAPLGIEVLKRNIIFIDLAIAQIAGLGVLAASTLLHEPLWWQVQLAALIPALAAAFIFGVIEKRAAQLQEALIGCSFVLAASLCMLLLADHPHGGEEVQHLFSGQLLFVSWVDVAMHAPVYIAILALLFLRPERTRSNPLFYVVFAFAVTSSVQLAGVYVVFASLILPALAAYKCKHPNIVAWGCGLTAVTIGIAAAMLLDVPAGPVMVASYIAVAVMFRIATLARR